jgi:hypothetical protein
MPSVTLPDYNYLHNGNYQIWYTAYLDLCIVAINIFLQQTHLMHSTRLVPQSLKTDNNQQSICALPRANNKRARLHIAIA